MIRYKAIYGETRYMNLTISGEISPTTSFSDEKKTFNVAHQSHYNGLKCDDHESNSVIREYGVEMIPMEGHTAADLCKYIDHVYDHGELCSCTAKLSVLP